MRSPSDRHSTKPSTARATASLQTIVEQWTREVEALGLEVKGLWLVDWDCGDGYYCWRHPEPSLADFHGDDEGFAARVPIN